MFHALSGDNKQSGGQTPAASAMQRGREIRAGLAVEVGTSAGHPGLAGHHLGNQASLRRLRRQAARCAACAQAQAQAQTRSVRPKESDTGHAPAIVHEVLREPGQPLGAPMRNFFEPRFGRNLSDVRVHGGGRAAESARAVNAIAYTVGQHIVVADGQHQPRSHFGMRVLAHELAHTLQQAGGVAGAATPLKIGDTGGDAEREADRAGAAAMHHRPPASVAAHPVQLSRWQVAGSTATVDSAQDRLGLLPDKVKSATGNWICIQPIAMRTASTLPVPADFQTHYERYLQIGDTFDLSNLTAKGGNNSLRLNMLLDPEVQAVVGSSAFYPGMRKVAKDPVSDMARQSGEGKTPLSEVILFGHAGDHSVYGDAGSITPKDLESDLPAPTYDRAHAGQLPHRCWLTTDAQARAVGCNSETFGTEFSNVFLRGGGGTSMFSTLRAVTLPSTPDPKAGDPKYQKELLFDRDSKEPADAANLGPFGDAASFHGSKYWHRTRGWL
jgi:hypothetical protein